MSEVIDSKDRIKYIDGLRGIAIMLVVLYHAYSRWPDIIPYKDKYAHFFIFQYGYLGVQLFFLISGFVILMTLEKCFSFRQFLLRRWLRLFPAMLIVTIVVYLSASLFKERPAGAPILQDIIPGITFIDPLWISQLFHVNQGVLEGAFWSLFVEMKFYLMFGAFYFLLGREKAITGIIVLSFFSIYFFSSLKYFDSLINQILCVIQPHSLKLVWLVKVVWIYVKIVFKSIWWLTDQFSFNYFCWFGSGALIYLYYKSRNIKILPYIVLSALISLMSFVPFRLYSLYSGRFIMGVVLFLLFFLPVISERFRLLFGYRIVVFIGFVSYPLYLIHENMMISIILKLGNNCRFIPDYLLPVFPITALITISYLIAKYAEPLLNRFLTKYIQNRIRFSSHSSKLVLVYEKMQSYKNRFRL